MPEVTTETTAGIAIPANPQRKGVLMYAEADVYIGFSEKFLDEKAANGYKIPTAQATPVFIATKKAIYARASATTKTLYFIEVPED